MSRTGTVSHILWHFTGGSRDGAPKPTTDAVAILKLILASKTVKRGSQKETLSLTIPMTSESNDVTWETASVVCLADIPIQSLSYHASHYGRVAIGFKRQSAISHGFNPVFYCSDKSLAMLEWNNVKRSSEVVKDSLKKLSDSLPENGSDLCICIDTLHAMSAILDTSLDRFERLFKNYSLRADHSAHIDRILNEREWRSLDDYKFDIEDISMIIVPEAGGFYADLVANRGNLGISDETVIVPWETLNIS